MAASDDSPSPHALPLMNGLPNADVPGGLPLVLASGSPRRSQLLKAAGYRFSVQPAGDDAECGLCSSVTAPELVARYAFRKALDVVRKCGDAVVLAADTVASCDGLVLGKPDDRDHAAAMLRRLSGRRHDVFTGVCLWRSTDGRCVVDVVRTELQMKPISDATLTDHLDSGRWEGKAGAFGFQDGNDWLEIVGTGSESNVVGLPMERLAEMLRDFDRLSTVVDLSDDSFDSADRSQY
ncbi:Maf-like protein YhdE [Crateriforma conspicua]|uniref:dTTP/UTP pyrophosphatase n=2 Tax=Crateriforma conspicua TaxID=2527996 RepID=A0A5C6FVK2_9PLAN|nr:nucleoside triphosphate pyrophosphatase [Crateriforma conspicua]TWU67027.1 Maf-like protein YhdE [Crateriforma conspicua]